MVSAGRLPGQVITDAVPILELDAQAIAAYGASSVQDLLAALGPQTGSGRGRGGGMPVMLINGARIGSFRELQDLPPEAIAKVEVLPEEVALQFGYRADQRVVNFVLKPNFRAVRAELRGSVPDAGGFAEHNEEVTLTRIADKNRFNLTLAASDVSALTEAERDIDQPAASSSLATLGSDPADDAAFRTLIADSRKLSVNASMNRLLGSGRSLALNGNVERNNSRSLFGLNQAVLALPGGGTLLRRVAQPRPLTRIAETDVFSASAAYNHPVGNWMVTLTGDGSLTRSSSQTDSRADFSATQSAVTAGTQNPAAAVFPQVMQSAPAPPPADCSLLPGLPPHLARHFACQPAMR